MSTFYINTYEDFAHNKIFETIMEMGLTFSKEAKMNSVKLEIQGSDSNYNMFEQMIKELNTGKIYEAANIHRELI